MGIPTIYKTPDEAVADTPDGASIMIGGFGHAVDKPQALLKALAKRSVKNLTIISNSAGAAGALGIGSLGGKPFVDEEVLLKNGQVRKAVCSVPASLVISKPNAFEKLYRDGKIELEYVPPGDSGRKDTGWRCWRRGILYTDRCRDPYRGRQRDKNLRR